ncbi:hypothetical protein PYCCODRAFT_1434914 [Trametes coccinea BRFM310]|uniref:F-box domain-containing protein n=1 Tax=Trametes coccinea (strain BRFM310) TaxID=1353009 RepID=A0A1Y2IPJ8_TRAC3|nr:hypothetical protein PYCCODRAFT_1434914 [Trametes coccinea BRFM310]
MSVAEQAVVASNDRGLLLAKEHVDGSLYIRVLACVELFRTIASYLTDPARDEALFSKDWEAGMKDWQSAVKQGRATIVSLAVVCKTISPSAISVLWERLDSAAPVVALCAIYPVADPPAPLPLSVQRYTDEVRAITLESGALPEALLVSRGTPVFPCLQRLHWVDRFQASIQPFVGLIVPTITDLRVHVESQAWTPDHAKDAAMIAAMLDGLRAASQHCLSLVSLELHWNDGRVPLPPPTELFQILPQMRSLRSLSVSAYMMAFGPALRVVSQLPSLRVLGISQFGGSHDSLDALGLDRVSSGFSLLEELSLAGSFSLVNEVLRCMPRCAVRRCTVTLRGWPSEDQQQTIVESVARKFRATIRAFSFTTGVLMFPNKTTVQMLTASPGPPFPIRAFDALRTLDLTDVCIGLMDPFHLTDEHCRDLALAWPHLRSLYLEPLQEVWYRRPAPPKVTLRGLRYFAEHCPALSDVMMQLDASGEHWAEAATAMPPLRRTYAVSLDLTTSHVTSPEAVAVYLKRAFCSFERVRFRSWMNSRKDMSTAQERLCGLLLEADGSV